MYELMINLGLLGQLSRWRRLGDGLRASGQRVEFSDLLPYIIGLSLVSLVIWGLIKWKQHNDMNQPCDDVWKLFRELCHAHGLNSTHNRLLRKLADVNNLEQPADIFVSPLAFELANLPAALQADQQQLRDLRAKLF